jgi:hypothetical membrane protein
MALGETTAVARSLDQAIGAAGREGHGGRSRRGALRCVALLSAPAAATIFLLGVIGFAAHGPEGYAHGTQMVSELGALGAPHALAFNILVFIVPGLLIATFGLALRQELGPSSSAILISLSGLSLVSVALFPIDPGFRDAPTNVLHSVFAQFCGSAFVMALILHSGALRAHPRLGTLGRITPWFASVLIIKAAWHLFWAPGQMLEAGWNERLNLAAYFAWMTLASWRLLQALRAEGADAPEARRT